VVLPAPERRPPVDGEQRLQHVGVGVLAVEVLRGQHDDRTGRVEAHHPQVGDVERVARPADDPGRPGVLQTVAQRLLHLDLVVLGQDDDPGALAAAVGRHELLDDREDLVGPAEDHGVVLLDHHRAALAQVVQLRADAVVQQADEGADDEQAADGEHEVEDVDTHARLVRQVEPEGAAEVVPEQGEQVADTGERQPDRDHDDEGDR